MKGLITMNEKTLENFKKLSPEKKEEIIAFLVRLLSYYPQEIFVQD